MASKIVLNTPRYKGEFDFAIDEAPLTTLEWRWVKTISGYLPLTLETGLTGGDPDLFVAFAVIALVRAGRVSESEALAAAKELEHLPADGVAITLVADEEEEVRPPDGPAMEPATEQPLRSIGASSKPTSESPDSGQRRTGALA